MAKSSKKIFVIGFNRCGTRTLHRMFKRSGLASAHWLNGELGEILKENKDAGRPPFEGLEHYDCFMDFHLPRGVFPLFEGQLFFKYFYEFHPDSYYILNTRDEEKWIASRFRHGKGRWANRVRKKQGFATDAELANYWRELWRSHHEDVRTFFLEHPGNFLEFNIEVDNPKIIQRFLKPDFSVQAKHYGWVGRRMQSEDDGADAKVTETVDTENAKRASAGGSVSAESENLKSEDAHKNINYKETIALGNGQSIGRREGEDRCVVFAPMRDEGPYILEWVAYHRLIGFDVVVASNQCNDDSDALLRELHKAGYIYHVDNDDWKGNVFRSAWRKAEKTDLVKRANWVIPLDSDEFLYVRVGNGRVHDLVEWAGDAEAVMVSWRCFGNNRRDEFEPGLVVEQFTSAAALESRINRSMKTLFRPSDMYDGLKPHRPRQTSKAESKNLIDIRSDQYWINGAGKRFDIRRMARKNMPRFLPEPALYQAAQVNHYIVRSTDSCLYKAVRGSPTGAERYGSRYLKRYNQNDVEETSILKWAGTVRDAIDVMLENDAVRDAHDNTISRYAELMRSVRSDIPSQLPALPRQKGLV